MIDINLIRKDAKYVEEALKRKGKIFSQQIIQYLCYNFFEGILEVS